MLTCRYGKVIFCVFLATLAAAASIAAAQTPPCPTPDAAADIPAIGLDPVAQGLREPVHLATADDASGRLFVVEQAGTIRIIENGRVLPEPFLDIRDRVESGGEKGLLSVAFHPRYAQNGLFYVDYTTRREGTLYTHVARFQRVSAQRADAWSETVLLEIEQPFSNHNGGQLAFGADGYLYIGMGDGGSANDPHRHGQNPATLLGKLLRIDVNAARGYAIPPDNPFAGQAGRRGEIWAYGLRNPWRFSFDAHNGDLYLADVGQDRWEEIDIVEKGGNYGWNVMEGGHCTPGVNRNCATQGLKRPLFEYAHPAGFSITGGFVYRGRAVAGLCGTYLYADYVTRKLWGLRHDGGRVTVQRLLLHTEHAISSFGQDAALELYILDHRAGKVLKIVAAR